MSIKSVGSQAMASLHVRELLAMLIMWLLCWAMAGQTQRHTMIFVKQLNEC